MLIGDITAVKYELNYNCLSQSIMRAGLQDVVRRTNHNHYRKLCSRQKSKSGRHWHFDSGIFITVFGYLFIYLLNATQRESLSPSGPKI